MCRLKEQALLACTMAAFLLIITAGFASAQDVPSHTQVSPAPGGGFDFPAQLTFFASLASSSNGIVANVTQGNFSNARALLGDYNRTVDDLNASAPNVQGSTVLDAVKASRDDFATFIKDAQRYNDLYVNETGLPPAAAPSNGSIANALEMRGLSATLKGLQSTIEGRNADIYGIAVNNGLDLSRYGNSTALFNAYATQGDHRLANVTANVFRTPALTLAVDRNNATYGDTIVLAGILQANQTGLSNSSVDLHVDNTTAVKVQTNATGSYAYLLPVREMQPGTHVSFAKYAPSDAPYNPSQSATVTFSVAQSPVNNTLSFVSGSIALGSNLQANGRLTTENGPVVNGTALLYVGDNNVARTQTDQNGTYTFSAPVNQYYLPALLSGATVYTVFDPSGQPLARTPSAAVHIPTDLTAAYASIVLIALVVLLSVFLYRRGFFRRAPRAVAGEVASRSSELPREEVEPLAVPSPAAPLAEKAPAYVNWNDVLDQARDVFKRGDDESATKALFDAAVNALSATAHVHLPPNMTYWEKYGAIRAAMPDVGVALRELTVAYELVHYGDRSLTGAQRDAALSAFASLREHVDSAERSP